MVMSVFPLLVIFLFMLYFMNSFYYILVLLTSMAYILILLIYSNTISTIFSLMVILVYAGAMMIFIGYICAVSPNPIFNSFYYLNLILAALLFIFMALTPILGFASSESSSMADFFYTADGVFVLFLLVFMLFVILILVSAQHFTPKGPFRSV